MSMCKCWLGSSGPEGSHGTRAGERLRSHRLRAAVITWAIGAGKSQLVRNKLEELFFNSDQHVVCSQWFRV
jgi:hypothetical protein